MHHCRALLCVSSPCFLPTALPPASPRPEVFTHQENFAADLTEVLHCLGGIPRSGSFDNGETDDVSVSPVVPLRSLTLSIGRGGMMTGGMSYITGGMSYITGGAFVAST